MRVCITGINRMVTLQLTSISADMVVMARVIFGGLRESSG